MIKAERCGPTAGCVTHLLDGNAVAGDLFTVFGREMTVLISAAPPTVRHPQPPNCMRARALRRTVVCRPAVTPSGWCWSRSAMNAMCTCRLLELLT